MTAGGDLSWRPRAPATTRITGRPPGAVRTITQP